MSEDPLDGIQGCDTGLSDEQLDDVLSRPLETETEVFAALSNETRYRILLLVNVADGGVCGCELEPHLDVKQSSISQSLSRLRKAGLLSRRKEGRWRYYNTTPLAEELLAVMADTERRSKLAL